MPRQTNFGQTLVIIEFVLLPDMNLLVWACMFEALNCF